MRQKLRLLLPAAVAVAILSACGDYLAHRSIKNDVMEYEGWPESVAECVASEFLDNATSEEVDLWLHMIDGSLPADAALQGHDPEAVIKQAYVTCGIGSVRSNKRSQGQNIEESPSITITESEAFPFPEDGSWVTEEVTSQKWIAVEGEDTYETSTFEQCIDFPIQDHQWVFYPNQECDVEILKSGRGVVSWKESCPDPDIADGRTETLIRTEYSRHETKRRIDIEVYGESIDSEVPLTRKEMEMRSTWSGSKCPE